MFLGTTNINQEMVVSGHAEIYWRYDDQCPWTDDRYWDRRNQQNDDMKRLLLLLVQLVLADPAIAFDGGWSDKEEKPKLSTGESKTLAKYSEFHQSCMDIQMTMWGEVAELMEDLAKAHCYCEYTKLEGLETITGADKNAADIECANQGKINNKEAFIWWALPLHRQRLEDEQE